jgi:endonuclease/exonuclease/phosphatase family metal-dependent hydrolase
VLSAIDADIVALQEVDRRFGRRASSIPRAMLAEKTDLEIVDLAHRPDSIGWHGNAILLRRGTEVQDIHTLALSGLEPRGAVVVDLENLRVVGVHLALLRRARQAQIAQIAGFLARLPYKPTLIMGDFNEWSRQSRNLSALDSQFNLHTPGHSFPSVKPLVGLDKIAISKELVFENSGVHSCEAARQASDHMPIWADISHQTA